ncbi:MAG: hypothetical protein WD544_01925, partial [Patescibacteria group bacterium]
VRLRRKGLLARGVNVYIRFGDKTGFGQHLLTKTYTADGYQLYQWAQKLLEAVPQGKPIRLIAISAYELVKHVEHSRSLFLDDHHHEKLLGALDKINNRYGEFAVHRAALSRVKQRIFKLPDGRNKGLYTPELESDQTTLRRRSISTSPFLKRL